MIVLQITLKNMKMIVPLPAIIVRIRPEFNINFVLPSFLPCPIALLVGLTLYTKVLRSGNNPLVNYQGESTNCRVDIMGSKLVQASGAHYPPGMILQSHKHRGCRVMIVLDFFFLLSTLSFTKNNPLLFYLRTRPRQYEAYTTVRATSNLPMQS